MRTYTYDAFNRTKTVQYSDGTPTVTYTYDEGGAAAFAAGRLTKIAEGSNTQTFAYDNLGRVTSVTHTIDGTSYVVKYGYNVAGEQTTITYPSNRVVTTAVDSIGRISSVSDGTTTFTNNFGYDAAGNVLGFAFGNGVQATYGYNDHLQISSIKYAKSPGELRFTYDYTTPSSPANNGQIQTLHFINNGVEDPTRSENFTYDSLGRLSTAQTARVDSTSGTWSLKWDYDRLGNRTAQTLVGGNVSVGPFQLSIDPNTNRITNTGFQYDAAGNLTNDSLHSFAYDGANRITTAGRAAQRKRLLDGT